MVRRHRWHQAEDCVSQQHAHSPIVRLQSEARSATVSAHFAQAYQNSSMRSARRAPVCRLGTFTRLHGCGAGKPIELSC
eukprot:3039981-Amphidinium_carterae.1